MEYLIHILIITGIYTILTLSLNLAVGFTGLAVFGHIAFACVGAYISSLLALNFGLSPWLGMLIGAISASLVGLIIGYPSIRLKGDYLALATLGLGIIVYSVSKNWVSLTNGPMGLSNIPRFSILGYEFSSLWDYLILITILVVLTYFVIRNITNSPLGRILKGIREDEVIVQSLGKNVNKYKLIALVVSAFFAGIAGSFYAHYTTFINPISFNPMESITVLLMVVFGGMASLPGSFIGASVLVIFPEVLRFLGMPSSIAALVRQMIYGLLLIVFMILRPQGLIGRYKFK